MGVETQAESTAGHRRAPLQHRPRHLRITTYVTLHPGDLVFTGTCGDPADRRVGDVVEVEIVGIGVLRNQVIGEE